MSQAVESLGVPTVALSMEEGMDAPRVARVSFPYNFPVGGPSEAQLHQEVVVSALSLLEKLDAPGEETLPFEWRG